MGFWETALSLSSFQFICLMLALLVGFGFEFINGFHDTANAVATVIYTKSLKPTTAVIFSGFMNFLGVMLGGTAVAFGIVNLLPIEKLVDQSQNSSLIYLMVFSMLIGAVIWNLGTWYVGLPVSSSHTLIGSIIGVGIAYGILSEGNLQGVKWDKVTDAFLALIVSPIAGFIVAALFLIIMKTIFRDQRLYSQPIEGEEPPGWIRWWIRLSCGGVSYFHGANDGQKGMGLLMLVLVGFMPALYALNPHEDVAPAAILATFEKIENTQPKDEAQISEWKKGVEKHQKDFELVRTKLANIKQYSELPKEDHWPVRQAIAHISSIKHIDSSLKKKLDTTRQYIPYWVIVMTALCLGIGTTIGYKRIVITVAEKIGKSHLTYAQGAIAQTIATITIYLATTYKLPVSTTHILSSGIAGTMTANKSGLQGGTVKKILLAWFVTLPVCMLLSGLLFAIGFLFVGTSKI